MHLVTENKKPTGKEIESFESELGLLNPDEILFNEEESEGPKIRYGYHAGGMRFLVPEGTVSELLQENKIYHLPNAPRWLVGLINMHGNVMPVVDIASYLGVEISHIKKSNILAIGECEKAIGILIDGFPEAVKDDELVTDVNTVPEKLSEYINSGIYTNGYYWYELNLVELFKNLALDKVLME